MIETNKIHQIDCIQGLKQIDSESVRLVFADPPYNLLGLDMFVDVSNYRKWVKQWCGEIKRILAYDGTFILCGRPPVLCTLVVDLMEQGLLFSITISKLIQQQG